MKISLYLFLGALMVAGLGFGLSGCVADGTVGVDGGVYYEDDPGPWFVGGGWAYGHPWYHGYNGGHGGWVHHRR